MDVTSRTIITSQDSDSADLDTLVNETLALADTEEGKRSIYRIAPAAANTEIAIGSCSFLAVISRKVGGTGNRYPITIRATSGGTILAQNCLQWGPLISDETDESCYPNTSIFIDGNGSNEAEIIVVSIPVVS